MCVLQCFIVTAGAAEDVPGPGVTQRVYGAVTVRTHRGLTRGRARAIITQGLWS